MRPPPSVTPALQNQPQIPQMTQKHPPAAHGVGATRESPRPGRGRGLRAPTFISMKGRRPHPPSRSGSRFRPPPNGEPPAR